MNQATVDKITDLIVQAATKLGFEAARIWPQMVAITWVQALFWMIADPILLAVVWLLFYRCLTKCTTRRHEIEAAQQSDNRYYSNMVLDGYWIVPTLVGLVGCIVTLGTLMSWPSSISSFLYPEAATVLRLVGR